MKSYNGFSPEQRYKALAYHKEQIKLGKKPPKPDCCDACGQTEGFLTWHSEDYSEPFGEHIGQHGVCYVCHMMIHCRFRNRFAWAYHIDELRKGKMPQPMHTANWRVFLNMHLNRAGSHIYLDGKVNPNSFIFDLA